MVSASTPVQQTENGRKENGKHPIGSYTQALHPLIVIQKKVIRTIARLRVRDHTNDYFHYYKILKLPDINKMISATFVYKYLNDLVDTTISFPVNPNRYATRNQFNLYLPSVSSSQSQSHIQYYGVEIYNSIPDEVKHKPSLPSFKSHLKKYLIGAYDN